MTGNEIREKFLQFFESKGHRRVRSSSLVPHGDPTLLFTNAGMNQFKDVFLGIEKREYLRATTAQKCVRAGGKHNDLENVGFTKRHHTFFEMLGNFSFGDYFKKDAVAFAWELLISPEWYGIPKDKLYVTVFGGAEVAPGNLLGVDEEAKKFWLEQQVPADRIVAVPGLKDNFWAMGDTGPCGPCSEIFYDMGPAASEEGHGDCKFPCECGRYVEIWNLVFMQFNRFWVTEREGGKQKFEDIAEALGRGLTVHEYMKCLRVEPLPKPCVDTGMGLERTAAVLQGVISNYDTDLFQPLIKEAARLTESDAAQPENGPSLRIIADHFRAATFLVADGVAPSNDGRGYVLRKILRRAFRHARKLNPDHWPFVSHMAGAVREIMGTQYPELVEAAMQTSKVLDVEEEQFHRITAAGLEKFEDVLRPWTEAKMRQPHLLSKLPGPAAFKIYETYGLPLDFMSEAAKDVGVQLDEVGFERALLDSADRARASWKGGTGKEAANPAVAKLAETVKAEPDFYHATCAKDARIEAIILTGGANRADSKNGPVKELKAGESGEVVLDRTVIYAESGGQMADTGKFYDASEAQVLAEVTGAFYPVAGLVAHRVTAKETLRVGDRVTVHADAERRGPLMWDNTGGAPGE